MKKPFTRILAGMLLIITLCYSLTACLGTKISGTYVSGDETTLGVIELVFDGNKIKYTETINNSYGGLLPDMEDTVYEYDLTYKIRGDKITIYSEKIHNFARVMDANGRYFGEHDFEKTDTYIKIDNVIYNKK